MGSLSGDCDHHVVGVLRIAVEPEIAELEHLLDRLLLVLLQRPIEKSFLPFFVGGVDLQPLEGQSHGERLLEELGVLVPHVYVCDVDLHVVDDFGGEVHHEARLVLAFRVGWSQLLILLFQDFEESLFRKLDDGRLQGFKSILFEDKLLPEVPL